MGLLDLIGHKYPFTDFHELNLDWCITAVLQLQKAFEDFSAGNKLTFAEPLQHNLTKTYAKNTIVVDPVSGSAYLSLDTVPVGVQLDNADYWLSVFDFAAYVTRANKNFTDNYFSGTDRTPIALAVGDWLILDDVLYKVAVAMAADDLFIIGTNIIHFTVEQFLKDFIVTVNQTLANYSHTIQQYKNDIDASELAYRQQLAQDIAATTAALQAQLDIAISGATVDSEVILARVGADGRTYSTLGDAIRDQVGTLNNTTLMEDTINKTYLQNVFPIKLSDWENGGINNDGTTNTSNLYIRTASYIPITKPGVYEITIPNNLVIGIRLYDENHVGRYYNSTLLTNGTFKISLVGSYFKLIMKDTSGSSLTVDDFPIIIPISCCYDQELINFTYGGIDASGVTTYPSEIRVTTAASIPVHPYDTYNIDINVGYGVTLVFFDISGTYLSRSGEITNQRTYQIPKNCFNLKFVLRSTSNNAIPDISAAGLKITYLYNDNYVSGDLITSWTIGGINSDGTENTVDTRMRTDFISVNDSNFYYLSVLSGTAYFVFYVMYDKDKNYIKAGNDIVNNFALTGIDGYFRLVVRANPERTLTASDFIAIQASLNTINTKSITYKQGFPLRLCTWNVGHWGLGVQIGYSGDIDAFKSEIVDKVFDGVAPDILFLQEYYSYLDHDQTVPYFNIPKHYYAKTVSGLMDVISTKICSTNYKIKEINTYLNSTFPADNLDSMSVVDYIIEFAGVDVHFVNVHMRNATQSGISSIAYPWLLSIVSDFEYAVIAGDFNAWTEDMYDLFSNDYNLANCGDFGVFHTWVNNDDYVLDQILTTKNIELTRVKMVEYDDIVLSDHKPFYADLVIKI